MKYATIKIISKVKNEADGPRHCLISFNPNHIISIEETVNRTGCDITAIHGKFYSSPQSHDEVKRLLEEAAECAIVVVP